MDFLEILQVYMRHLLPVVGKQTYYKKEWELKRFYRYLQKVSKCFDMVTRSDIEAYLVSIKHCKASTRREWVMTVRDFYRFAVSKYMPDFINPVYDITFMNYKQPVIPAVPGIAAMDILLQSSANVAVNCTGERSEMALRNYAMAELNYGSGLRRGELAAINIEDIDTESRKAYICGKGGYTRIVPLTAVSVDAVCRYIVKRKSTRGPLFVTSTGRRLSGVGIGWIFRIKTGIRPHLMRHACATHLLKNGCSLRHIQELLGHKHLTTTQVYTHIISTDVAEAVKRLHPRSI